MVGNLVNVTYITLPVAGMFIMLFIVLWGQKLGGAKVKVNHN